MFKQFKVVDFDADKASEAKLMAIVEKHSGNVTDWMEQGYGLVVFVDVPEIKAGAFDYAVDSERNFVIQ